MNKVIIQLYNFSKVLFFFLAYILTINIFSFILMLIDKYRAIRNHWRVKEITFIIMSIIGGALGVLLGMVAFRHKTNKKLFYIGIPIIFIINIVCLYVILNRIL